MEGSLAVDEWNPAPQLHGKVPAGFLIEANLIGPDWIADYGSGHLDVTDPANGNTIGKVPSASASDVERALRTAALAFGRWKKVPARTRSAALRRWYELINEAKQELAQLLTAEQGKPLAEAAAEIEYAASFVRWYSEEAERVYGRTAPSPDGVSRLTVTKVPVGVVAAITPWNAPSSMVTRKVAPAIAAGCAVVLKPAEATPFSALALAKLALAAGIDAGVLNVVTGDPAAIGAVLTRSPLVRKLSFTGSTPVARNLLAAAAGTMMRVSLEAGGNAPFIVLPDAEVDAAVATAMVAKFRAGGQSCVAANRFFVHSSLYEPFAAEFTRRVRLLQVGAGSSGADVGPVIDVRAAARIGALIDDAVLSGATLLCGGHRKGTAFVVPAVVRDIQPGMRLFKEEVFGPVAGLCPFDDVDALVAALNEEETGLIAYVMGYDGRTLQALADRLDVGMVGLNTGLVSDASMPFGGMKCSGLGREGSREGIEAYLETKYVKAAR